jgi:ribose transport system substrate-binding protein
MVVLSLIMAISFLVSACGGSAQTAATTAAADSKATIASAQETKKEEPAKKFVVGFSNGYIGNGWRNQMIEDAEKLAELYKGQGLLEKLIVQNAGTDVNNQIAQIKNMINAKVDLLLIDPNSETALNPVIEEAVSRGIVVIALDQAVTSKKVTANVVIDQKKWGATLAEWLCTQLNGKGNIVNVEGMAGHPANVRRQAGINEVLAKYPDIKVLTSVNGNWDQANSQQVMSNVLASYPNIDGVISQDGMALGVAKAFQAANRPIPPMTGELMVGFLKTWKELKDSQNFSTIGESNPPGISATALGIGIRVLQGKKLKALDNNTYYYPVKDIITNDKFDAYYETVKDKPDSYFPDEWLSEEELDALFE